jgi:hypothetical protein
MDGAPNARPTAEAAPDEAALRLLRRLVTALTVVMIGGIVAVATLLVIRMPALEDLVAVPVPEALALPDGAVPTAFTRGRDWFAVVTQDGRILVFGPEGALRREVRLDAEGG